ncbi:sensor histidine kinase [Pseudogracilibacillus auburnensis]|uniref:histidine kinase n=1 Tax=Pseudogracilibacillus auburnensis TaxID=1494959 RepID=A0A2V3VWI3_9BACI|nr:sensor histidine kinase [Pseudogracilibacillus auburnensis]MBO1002340.1 sensor histidine kinase [Pseudogracilibacillus auburnensis]PXW86272.1 signal transduction histidine kinase [Pseudogracilibacillus auburnensis]
MKLFLREHVLLIIVQIIQFITIAGIFWLAGFRHIQIAMYSIFLSLFFLFCYLAYHYVSRRQFYHRLSTPIRSLDESLQELDHVAIATELNELLKSQYSTYQNQLMEMNKAQEEHLIFMDRWIHQMKTPLSVLELMAEDLDEPAASSFREETDRLKTGLNMVLYMARLRTIEQDFHIKRVSLLKIVQEVNRDNKRLFIRNHIFPQVKELQEGITVETDEKWLFFMMTQFIHNAVKYSAGKSSHIDIIINKRFGHTVLEITDSGIGISDADIKRVFDAFYTGENGRKFRESTGVGLFLVKEVAKYLGHKIEVESTEGKGSTFRIVF